MNERQARAAIIIGSLIIILLMLTSCKQIQVVTEYRDRIVHDTTQLVDSVYTDRIHYLTQKGDTVFKVDSIYLYKYKYLDRKVDVYVHDSIPYPVEVVKEVKHTSGFAKFCIAFFIIVLTLGIGWGAWKIYRRFFLHV